MKCARLIAMMMAIAMTSGAPVQAWAAKPVFRCDEGGRITYADEPCAHSTGRSVNVDDKRTPRERRDAVGAAKREAEFARMARKQRLAEERVAEKRRATGIQSVRQLPVDEPKKKLRRSVGIKKAPKAKKTDAPTVSRPNAAFKAGS